jgi:hypothetical protein
MLLGAVNAKRTAKKRLQAKIISTYMHKLAGFNLTGYVSGIKDQAPILGRELFIDEDFISVLYFFHNLIGDSALFFSILP